MLYAAIKQRTPNSAPEQPVNTLSLMTCGALVLVAPTFGSLTNTDHTLAPVLASKATMLPSFC